MAEKFPPFYFYINKMIVFYKNMWYNNMACEHGGIG